MLTDGTDLEEVERSAPGGSRARWSRRLPPGGALRAGVAFLGLLVLVAIFAPLLAPHGPNSQELTNRFASPNAEHWLGTDKYGRDNLSRLVFGTRVTLLAGVQVVALSVVLGVPSGLVAGFFGRVVDRLLSLVDDALMSVPALILALAVVAITGPGLTNAMLAVGIAYVPRFFRLARMSSRDVAQETYIEASASIGCSRWRTLGAHVLPNILPPLIVQASFAFGSAVLAEASLSFLGLGVRPPTPSWGAMLLDASQRLDKSYLIWGPGVALTATVLAVLAVGDGWRRAVGVERARVDP